MNNLLLPICLFALAAPALAQSQPDALAPMQAYVRAHETGDPAHLRQAFSADAKVIGYRNGALVTMTLDEYAAKFSGRPAPDEAQRRRSIEIIDQTVDAAVGKVVLDYPAIKFTDYMALLKIDGQWRIVNKSFHAQPKAAQK